jgi:hypothetical protein
MMDQMTGAFRKRTTRISRLLRRELRDPISRTLIDWLSWRIEASVGAILRARPVIAGRAEEALVFKIRLERRGEPLASRRVFFRRLAENGIVTFVFIGMCWIGGAIGYHVVAGIPTWLDSFYNAAMILGGMGPVSEITRPAGKIFASFYALFCGVFLIASVGYFLTPVFHRVIHVFHLDADDSPSGG